MATETFAETAPAKINLALHVVARRADGYHELDSLVVFADLADRLTARRADAFSLTLTGPLAAGVPVGADNLVTRALGLAGPLPPLAITLEKVLPHAAGLGGGSADAAAALRLAARALGRPLPDAQTVAALGADIPVCLGAPRPARMRGIGERV
ncbi:MAG: 4-(cytidine 5'-diphospho)-2-C-methyl-D-erythritol kinase, partial [Alphaproteobacteria bacterium]